MKRGKVGVLEEFGKGTVRFWIGREDMHVGGYEC